MVNNILLYSLVLYSHFDLFLYSFIGHTQNVSAVSFHPELPILITGSEDGTVKIWHAGTYRYFNVLLIFIHCLFKLIIIYFFRLESSLNYGFERVWTISCMHGSNNVALGYLLQYFK